NCLIQGNTITNAVFPGPALPPPKHSNIVSGKLNTCCCFSVGLNTFSNIEVALPILDSSVTSNGCSLGDGTSLLITSLRNCPSHSFSFSYSIYFYLRLESYL